MIHSTCNKCNANIVDGSYCPLCGTQLARQAISPELAYNTHTLTKQPKQYYTIVDILALLAIVIVVVQCMFGLSLQWIPNVLVCGSLSFTMYVLLSRDVATSRIFDTVAITALSLVVQLVSMIVVNSRVFWLNFGYMCCNICTLAYLLVFRFHEVKTSIHAQLHI
jgi:hypothetical protein